MTELTIEQHHYLQSRIDEVMDWFDFEKVHKAMVLFDWEWFSLKAVPEVPDLRKFVRDAMKYTYNEVISGKQMSHYITGGFNIQCIRDEDDVIFFKVVFELADWQTDD